MKKLALLSIVALGTITIACTEDANSLTGGRQNTPGQNGEAEGEGTPAALQCTEKPEGRSYVLFDGSKLEGNRANENVGVNRARFKPYSVMAGEYQRVIGVIPKSLATAGASFDDPPARWYEEAAHSGVSLNAQFDISFEACVEHVKTPPELAQAPNADTAKTFCSSLMRKAWSKTAQPAEVDGCVELATKKLETEPDVRRRWAYVCASILSSSHFLTF
jgi:hypothetical protein